jgi:hypothetical protein
MELDINFGVRIKRVEEKGIVLDKITNYEITNLLKWKKLSSN